MREEQIEFYSEGVTLRGLFRFPDDGAGPYPCIVQGPGWLGLAEAATYRPWHTALTDAGYAVCVFDYRGFGLSDGEPGWILPERQVADILAAVAYVRSRADVDPTRLGCYGMGGTGGGNAIVATALEADLRCVVVQSVIADGREWLRRMRREYEWLEFLERLRADEIDYVVTGVSELVDPRAEIMIATPERHAYKNKRDVDVRIAPEFRLQSATALIRYRPIDYLPRLGARPLLITCVEDDSVTPADHALRLYAAAVGPKRLVVQRGTTHYASYTDNYDRLAVEIVSWYDRYLGADRFHIIDESSEKTL
jgi:dipeptidyl aminopeptidase/acylaminoacyl peptidase